ncbi:MAG: hypothetical protein M3Q69_21915 [Acidobacteriota bacterium]|nr:hypothetical protein [Acidobacteriota bacterium]
MTCETFRARFVAGTEDHALLAHLRTCDRCLDMAAHADPDVMFRALGGEELVPPGGIDAFVDDVMQQVRVRGAETMSERKVVSWPRRLAVAATLVAGITGAMLYRGSNTTVAPVATPHVAMHRPSFVTKPVVETYESEKATIVEMPREQTGDDVQIVMIFDENLRADL